MIHTSPIDLSEGQNSMDYNSNEGFDSPRYDDRIQSVPLQTTKQVNGFSPISMSTPQSNLQKNKPINKGFMAIPMDESPIPQKVNPPPKPNSSGSRLLRKNTIDKAIDTASVLTADTSLLGAPSVIQKAPSKQKQQFHPMDDFDDGVSGMDGFQGNVPPISDKSSTINPFSIPPIPKKSQHSQSNALNQASVVSTNQPLSGAESFQLFTQLPPIPIPPSSQNPLSAMKKNVDPPVSNLEQSQSINKVQFAPIAHPKGRFNNQSQQFMQQDANRFSQNMSNYQNQNQQAVAMNISNNEMNNPIRNNVDLIIEEEEDIDNDQYNQHQQIFNSPIEKIQRPLSSTSAHNTSPRFQDQNGEDIQELRFQPQQNNPQNYTFGQGGNLFSQQPNFQNSSINQQNQGMLINQNNQQQNQSMENQPNLYNSSNQQFQQQAISNQPMQQQTNQNSQNQIKNFDQKLQQQPISTNLYQNQQQPVQSTPYQPQTYAQAAQPSLIAPSLHSYQPLFYGPLGSLELNFVYTFNRSSSTLKRLFTGEFNNLMKQQAQTATVFDSIDIDEFTNSITSEISQIIETPIQNCELNQPGITRRISTVIDEETKLMTIGLREVDAKNATAMENQVNELKKLQIELDTLKNSVKTTTDEILREFEKERSDTISMREFNQSFINELERRSRSIQIKQVELSSKATHQNVEKESIERMMKQLSQKKQSFDPFDHFIPERGANINELISSEINKIKQIIRQSKIDNDEYEYQDKSLSSQSIISEVSSVSEESVRILQDELENQKKELVNLQMSNRIMFAQAQAQAQSGIMQNGFSALSQASFQPTSVSSDVIRKKRGFDY